MTNQTETTKPEASTEAGGQVERVVSQQLLLEEIEMLRCWHSYHKRNHQFWKKEASRLAFEVDELRAMAANAQVNRPQKAANGGQDEQ